MALAINPDMIPEPYAQDFALQRSPRQRQLKLAALLVTAVAVLAVLGYGVAQLGGAQRSVAIERLRLEPVTRGVFVSDVTAQGRVVAAVSPTLYAPALGTVSLKVQAGDKVEQGQLLALLDSPEITSEVAREAANLAGLKAAYARERLEVQTRKLQNQQTVDLALLAVDAAEREKQRARDGYEMGVLPVMEADRRADELAAAQLRARHAQAEGKLQAQSLDFQLKSRALDVERQQLVVDNMQRRADELQITAPVAGIIGTLAVAQRAAVAANAPLMTVVDLSALEVEIQVPETYADSLGIDMPAEVRLGAQIYPGKLAAIAPEVAKNQVTGRVAFTGPKPPELRQNQRVSVRVVLDQRRQVVQLPRGSFVESGGGRYAYIVRDGLATRTPVSLGAVAIDRVEILSGAAPGDVVVISGDQAFENANTVRVRE